jgi:signal peptide peptidase SppA
MLRTDDVLAIDLETFRHWREIAKDATPDQIKGALSPEAATRLLPGRKDVGDIAVVPLSGFVTQKPTIWSELFGGTSTEALVAEVRTAMAEPSIGAVVLDVDSPGGTVVGLPEAAAAIRGVRGPKPLVAVVNPFMASAAYWLGSQADEIVATPSSLTGSIGVMAVYVDESKALEGAGLSVEEIVYGRRKAEASGLRPLTDEAREAIQDRVDYYGQMFEADVAKGRGIGVGRVRTRYGQGTVFNAGPAQAAGLVDRIGLLEGVIRELAKGYRPPVRMRADSDPVEMRARASLAGLPGLDVE